MLGFGGVLSPHPTLQTLSWGSRGAIFAGEGGPAPPPPPWYQVIVNLFTQLTPLNALILVGIGAVIAGAWYAISDFYDTHALALDVGETGGTAAYAAGRQRHKKHRGKKPG